MRLAREWDLRFENLLRTGSLGKWYSAVGNEATTVAAAACLRPGDALTTLHRDVGAIFAYRLDVEALLSGFFGARGRDEQAAAAREYLHRLACQMLGKAEGFTEGFDRSYHFGEIDRARGCIHVGMISHLGAMIPVAAGLAFEQRFRARQRGGESAVTLNFIGDGGTSTGDFHEGLNIASVWKLPLILVIENNRYAFSTPVCEQYAAERLADRGCAYGIPGVQVDGNDARAVFRAVAAAVSRARRGDGPTLIEAMVGRLRGHAEGDGSFEIVPQAEVADYRASDPLPRLDRELRERGWAREDELRGLDNDVRQLLIAVSDRARGAADPDPAEALPRRAVFAPAAEPAETPRLVQPVDASGGTTSLDAITRALREEMLRDSDVVLLGQDIGGFGGAFRATAGLLEEFGPERVRNTPIAESGTLGIAAGAALVGLRPVVEMQFADFVSCGFNQLVNVAAKHYFRWRAPVPMVVRCPVGGGAGAGPFHSQNPESWFAHVPGLKVVAPAFPHDVLGLLKAAIRDGNPVLFLEHKHLYRRAREALPDGDVLVPIGKARIVRPGRHASVFAYGWMVLRALDAAARLEQEGFAVEVVDLRSLVPLDREAVLDSVRRTSRALIVHEANLTCGFGAELGAWIADAAFEWLDAPVRRVAYPDVPVPHQKDFEAACLPDEARIAAAVRELVRF
jgi:2-oxoisovalerate dehydrogenase E1 component